MPRYFFHVQDGTEHIDREGVEFPNIEVVRAQAVVATGSMLHDHGAEFWKDGEWRMWVTDEAGTTVCAVQLTGN